MCMEQEINLMDYIKTIIRKWRMISIITLGITAIVFLVSFLSPRIYELSTMIEIGGYGQTTLLESPAQVKNKIEGGIYGIDNLKAENLTGTNLVIIKMKSSDIGGGEKNLEKTINLILDEHQKMAGIQKNIANQEIQRLNNKIDSLEKKKLIIEEKLNSLEKLDIYQQSSTFQISYLDEKNGLENKKSEIENIYSQILALQKSVEFIQPTKAVKSPSASGPIGPRVLFNTLIALILGLFIGLITAFCTEWWAKNR